MPASFAADPGFQVKLASSLPEEFMPKYIGKESDLDEKTKEAWIGPDAKKKSEDEVLKQKDSQKRARAIPVNPSKGVRVPKN